MGEWVRVGRPGAFSVRKHEIERNYQQLYGEHRIVWSAGAETLDLDGAIELYTEAYRSYFESNLSELDWMTTNYEDVYDNNLSNITSGCDYKNQEFGGNHYQDIAIRKAAKALGFEWARNGCYLEIRTTGMGAKWGPGNIPFHRPELIPQPELPGWWNAGKIGKPGSLESYWQSAKYLEVKDPKIDLSADIYFATGNTGKAAGAQSAIGDAYHIIPIALHILEELDDVNAIAKHKAKVAYSSLCRPVLADDSGFRIPSLGDWPDHHVKRELERKREGYETGLDYFIELAKQGHTEAYFIEVIAYHDSTLQTPVLFESRVPGRLITEVRGDITKPHVKSPLWGIFIQDGQTKTNAEWTLEELHANHSDRWTKLREYLKNR